MRHSFLVTTAALLIASVLDAQSFQSTYGGMRMQQAVAAVVDATGITSVVRDASQPDGPISIRLMRTDVQGNGTQWHDVDLGGSCFPQAAIASGDGNILLCGSRIAPGRSDQDALIAKVSITGTVLWSWTSNTPDVEEELLGLVRTSAGNIGACGMRRAGADSDGLLVQLTAAGALTWLQHYGTAGDEKLHGITSDAQGYVAVGRTSTFGGSGDTYIVRTDGQGVQQWWQSWGDIKDEELFAVTKSGNNFIMVGHTDSYGISNHLGVHLRNVYVMAMDASGDTLWTRAFGDTVQAHAAHSIAVASNGDLLFGGHAYATSAKDALMMRASNTGTFLWKRYYHPADQRDSSIECVWPLTDGNFYGSGGCFGPDSGQVLLLKKNATGQ